jgi:putative inorganic carbon (HCO3(-)) transporter
VAAPWLRRAADACLLLVAWGIPLSTSGAQIGAVGLVVLAVAAQRSEHPVIGRTPFDGVLALFFATLAVSTLASGRPLEGAGWARLWIVIAFYGVFWWLDDEARVDRLVGGLVVAGCVAAAYGVLQHFTGADWYRALLGRQRMVRPRIEGAEGYASVGFFRNYLTYAHVMLVPLGFMLARASGGSWLALVAAPITIAALVCSTARGSWLALGAMAVALVLRTRGGGRMLLAGGVLVGVMWFGSAGLREQIVPAIVSGDPGRAGIVRANLDIIHDHPVLGLGFGRYQRAATPYYDRHPDADRRSHAHSNYLQMAAEAGLVGLAAFMLLLVTPLRRAARAMRTSASRPTFGLALGGWLAVIGFAVGGLTQYSFGDNEVAVAMWTTLAVIARLPAE